MTKRLVIAALFLAVAAGLWLLSRGCGSGQAPNAEAPWPSFTPAAVRSLRFELPGPGFELTLSGPDWAIRPLVPAQPVPGQRLDAARIADLLELLARSKPKRALGAHQPGQAKEYGLDSPRVRLRIALAPAEAGGPSEIVLELGRQNPAGDGVYALNSLAPDALFLVDPAVLRQLEHGAEFYLDSRVFETAEKDVALLRVSGPSGLRFEAVRRDGAFVFARPAQLAGRPLSEAALKQYLRDLLSLKAGPALPAETRPAAALLTVEIAAAGAAEPETLELFRAGDHPDQVLAGSDARPGLFVLARDQAALLDRTAFDLLDRSVVTLDIGRIESFQVQCGTATFLAEKTATGWVERGGGRDVLGIDMALWRFNELQFEAAPAAAPPPAAAWVMTCEPRAADGRVIESLAFYSDPGLPAGRCWLRVGAERKYYPVPDQLLKDLQGLFPVKK